MVDADGLEAGIHEVTLLNKTTSVDSIEIITPKTIQIELIQK